MKIESVMIKALSLGLIVREDEPMSTHTTFRIGGPAKAFIECNDIDKLKELLAIIKKENVPFWVIGKGSNLLVSDDGLDGVVLYICDDKISVDGNIITARAGAKLSSVCNAAKDASLSGLEFAFGIPGSVGGAVYMNAGAYGGEMKQCIASCTAITLGGEIKHYNASELEFSYRTSVFKQNGEIILEAKFSLIEGKRCEVGARMDAFLARRKDKQPLDFPNAGSTFKRPEGHFAGALIEQCGLKGFAVGGAEVSEKHAGFVINRGNATCEDVKTLIKHIKEKVLNDTGVELEPEIVFLCGENTKKWN